MGAKSVTQITTQTSATDAAGSVGSNIVGSNANSLILEDGATNITQENGELHYNPFSDNVLKAVNSSLLVADKALQESIDISSQFYDKSLYLLEKAIDTGNNFAQNAAKNTEAVLATKETRGLSPIIPWIIGGVVLIAVFAVWKTK